MPQIPFCTILQGQKIMGNQEWRDAYQKFTPHVESGYREIFTVVQ